MTANAGPGPPRPSPTPTAGRSTLYAVDWDAYGGNALTRMSRINDGSGPRVGPPAAELLRRRGVGPCPDHASRRAARSCITVDQTAGESAVLCRPVPRRRRPHRRHLLPAAHDRSPGQSRAAGSGTYGHDGYILGNWNGNSADLANLPAGVTYASSRRPGYTWASPTTDVRALHEPEPESSGGRRPSTTPNEVRVRLTFANAYSGTLHALRGRLGRLSAAIAARTSRVDDGSGPRIGHLAANSFVPGAWVHFPITVAAGGSVIVTVDRTAGNNAVLPACSSAARARRHRRRPCRVPRPDSPRRPATARSPSAWTAPASQRRQLDHRLHRDRAPRVAGRAPSASLGCTVTGLTNGTPLHLHRHRDQRRRDRPCLGGPGQRDTAADRAGCPDRAHRDAGQRPGRPHLDRARPPTAAAPITGYTATASPGGGDVLHRRASAARSPGLTNGTALHASPSRRRNAVGHRARLGPAAPRRAPPPPTVPGAPTGLTATPGNAPGGPRLDRAGLQRRQLRSPATR